MAQYAVLRQTFTGNQCAQLAEILQRSLAIKDMSDKDKYFIQDTLTKLRAVHRFSISYVQETK